MKKTIIMGLILTLLLIGCAGTGIKLADNSATVLRNSATSTVGYLIVKNNPQFRAPMVEWYKAFQQTQGLTSVQQMFQAGIIQLSNAVSDDPFLILQINNAIKLLEINIDGPQTELDIEKYRIYVDSFMMGVSAAPYNM